MKHLSPLKKFGTHTYYYVFFFGKILFFMLVYKFSIKIYFIIIKTLSLTGFFIVSNFLTIQLFFSYFGNDENKENSLMKIRISC